MPGESLQASVTYTPAAVDTTSVEYFYLKCLGALGESRLKVTGQCEGWGHGCDRKNEVPCGGTSFPAPSFIFLRLFFFIT